MGQISEWQTVFQITFQVYSPFWDENLTNCQIVPEVWIDQLDNR